MDKAISEKMQNGKVAVKNSLNEAVFEVLTNTDRESSIKVLKSPALTLPGTAGFSL